MLPNAIKLGNPTRRKFYIDEHFLNYSWPMTDSGDQKFSSVNNYIASLPDDQIAQDAAVLSEIMSRMSASKPKLWNVGTIGFDTYHYKYDSKREGDNFIIGFYPRKGKITVYLMDGTTRYTALLQKLGKHSITGYCIYFKRLADIELPILEQIVRLSYEFIKSKSLAGPIDHILWQT